MTSTKLFNCFLAGVHVGNPQCCACPYHFRKNWHNCNRYEKWLWEYYGAANTFWAPVRKPTCVRSSFVHSRNRSRSS